jgi:hypothetical protein
VKNVETKKVLKQFAGGQMGRAVQGADVAFAAYNYKERVAAGENKGVVLASEAAKVGATFATIAGWKGRGANFVAAGLKSAGAPKLVSGAAQVAASASLYSATGDSIQSNIELAGAMAEKDEKKRNAKLANIRKVTIQFNSIVVVVFLEA